MPKRRSDLRAGLFILLSLGLVGGAVVAIKGVRTVFVHETVRKVRFTLKDDIGGLRVGDDVRLGGYKVGQVDGIDVAGLGTGGDPHILIRFTLPEQYPLGADAHMFVEASLTGTAVLNIDSLGAGPVLMADQELTGHLSGISSLLADAGEAGPEIRQIIDTIRNSTLPHIDAASAQLPDTLASYRTTSDHARAAVDQFGSVFGDTKADIRGTMANLNSITAAAKARIPDLLDHANTVLVKAAATVDDAKLAMVDVRGTLANTRALTAGARDVVLNNKGKFDGVIASLKNTSDNLKEATAEVRRNPWRLLYKPAPGEMDNLALYDAARQFAEGANHVDDAALALRDAMQNPNVDHDQVQALVGKLNDSFDHFNAVEQKLWSSVKP